MAYLLYFKYPEHYVFAVVGVSHINIFIIPYNRGVRKLSFGVIALFNNHALIKALGVVVGNSV